MRLHAAPVLAADTTGEFRVKDIVVGRCATFSANVADTKNLQQMLLSDLSGKVGQRYYYRDRAHRLPNCSDSFPVHL